MQPERQVGRPRKFDYDDVLDRAVTTFWSNGATATTTRVLEAELGMSQSSLYQAFGSKEQLVGATIERYEQRLEAAVLARLDRPSKQSLLDFIDALHMWVSNDQHRGCLILNLAAEKSEHQHHMKRYRIRLREAVSASLATFLPPGKTDERTELVIAAAFGLTLAARTGATTRELKATAAALSSEIGSW